MLPKGRDPEDSIGLCAHIVAAYVSNNIVEKEKLVDLIRDVHKIIISLGKTTGNQGLIPAVPIEQSITQNYLICLEDGRRLKLLKRYLRKHYDLTPEQYRARWGLPHDYPMASPAYSEKRRQLAKQSGLGKSQRKKDK